MNGPTSTPPAETAPTAKGRRQGTRQPWTLAILACALCVYLAAQYFWLQVGVVCAYDRLLVFESMKSQAAHQSDPRLICYCLGYVANHYPSGTLQAKGSAPDRIIEISRANAIGVIAEQLHKITGKTFGSDVNLWLKEYPPEP